MLGTCMACHRPGVKIAAKRRCDACYRAQRLGRCTECGKLRCVPYRGPTCGPCYNAAQNALRAAQVAPASREHPRGGEPTPPMWRRRDEIPTAPIPSRADLDQLTMTAREACELVQISPGTIEGLDRAGRLKPVGRKGQFALYRFMDLLLLERNLFHGGHH